MIGLPVEIVGPLTVQQFVVVMVRPGIEFIEHRLHSPGIGHGANAVTFSAACHAASCQQLILVDHCCTANGIAYQLEISGSQRLWDALLNIHGMS